MENRMELAWQLQEMIDHEESKIWDIMYRLQSETFSHKNDQHDLMTKMATYIDSLRSLKNQKSRVLATRG